MNERANSHKKNQRTELEMRQKYLFQSFKLIYLLHYYNFQDSHLNIVKILEIILILLPPP